MTPFLAAFGLSGGELLLVLTAVLILFGAKKIPEFAKGLGQGIKEFKKASREVQDEIERAAEDINPTQHSVPPPPPPSVEPQQTQEQNPTATASSTEGAPPPAPPSA
ncbi:MAG TPA: twin-arginine translocase TatA/TatE family subunit [Verrucomicrobiota bacterium]|nr:twin-arginine translocase TatA/TatE family subunit [Verrucomicrobiota bacterium]HOK76452.1 twin-arginine translocase TatA/TatE family subunit [Verrucomicrobiota bacterium]